MAEVWNTFFTNGVISGLEVSSTSSGLSVGAGSAIINGYWYKLDSVKTLAIASGTSEHTDTVVLRLDLGSEARNITAVYKSGTSLTKQEIFTRYRLHRLQFRQTRQQLNLWKISGNFLKLRVRLT